MGKVIRVKGIKKFKRGQVFKEKYRWPQETKRDYYHKVVKPVYGGKGAETIIIKVKEDGKTRKHHKKSFLWNHSTQIGRVTPTKGTGRAVLIKSIKSKRGKR